MEILEKLSGLTINESMRSISQLHLNWVWDQFNLEYMDLDKWLESNYPKRELGKASREEYQSKHSRHLYLGEILANARICSKTWFEFGKTDYVNNH